MKPILIVDDEKAIADLICLTLTQAGYACVTANDGRTAADLIENNTYDLVLLDIMLPEIDGYELIEYARQYDMPVIFITAKTDVVDRVKGLRMGADDYIVKPFEPSELLARAEAVLRRTGRGSRKVSAWDVTLDPVSRSVMQNGKPLLLAPREFDLLALLIRGKGEAMYRDYLYETVWGDELDLCDTRTLDTHIQRLRKKLNWQNKITTVYKIGYRLEADA